MLQEAIAVKNPVVAVGPLSASNLAASQSDVQLALPAGNTGIVMPCGGYVIGFSWKQSAAASAGSMTIGVTIDGTEKAATTQTVTTAVEGRPTFKTDAGAPRFAAGEEVGLEFTTDASWNATTADLDAVLFVVFEGWDF